MRGRSMHQRGTQAPVEGWEEVDEGRAAANGRAENKGYKNTVHAKGDRVRWRTTGMREVGRIYDSSVVTMAGNLCNTSRRWDRKATQHL